MHQALAERVSFTPILFPQDAGGAAKTSVTVPMAGYTGVCFLVEVGDIDDTIDAKVQECTAADGTGATDITGAAITQIGATSDNRLVIVDVKPGTWRVGYPHLRVVVTPGGGSAQLVSVVAARYGKDGVIPVTQAASMAELVKV